MGLGIEENPESQNEAWRGCKVGFRDNNHPVLGRQLEFGSQRSRHQPSGGVISELGA